MLAYALGCRLAPRLAVIAPVAGAMEVDCHPAAPLSVIAFHGTADRNVRYQGGPSEEQRAGQPRVDPPVHQTISFWARHDGCPPSPETSTNGPVVYERYQPCGEGTQVLLVTITGGGHAWPGGKPGSPRGDTPTRAVSATDLIAEFLKAHPKAGPGP
jgi:polyhydroxybutyrate depolymerase